MRDHMLTKWWEMNESMKFRSTIVSILIFSYRTIFRNILHCTTYSNKLGWQCIRKVLKKTHISLLWSFCDTSNSPLKQFHQCNKIGQNLFQLFIEFVRQQKSHFRQFSSRLATTQKQKQQLQNLFDCTV